MGNFAASSATCLRTRCSISALPMFERISAIQSPICSISGSRMPRVVTEGLPRRIPPPFIGGNGSKGMEFDQEKMVVRAARYDAEAVLRDGGGHGFGVGYHLLLIFLEGGLHCFFQ